MLPGVKSGHKPAPFVKPSISISEDISGSRKRWVRADPRNLVVGDIIRGEGLIEDISHHWETGPFKREGWVTFYMKNGKRVNALVLPDVEPVIAFTEAEGEPVG